jgi:hypothetical protein
MNETRTGKGYRLQVFVPPPLEEVSRPEWCIYRSGECCTWWVSPYLCKPIHAGVFAHRPCHYKPSLWTRLVRLFGYRRPSMRWSEEPQDLVAGEEDSL